MILKLKGYRINIYTSYYKDQSPDVYIISPYIYVDYYSCEYYYEKRYTIGLSWLFYDFSIYLYIKNNNELFYSSNKRLNINSLITNKNENRND